MYYLKRMLTAALTTIILLIVVIALFQRNLLYFPSHHERTNGLTPWVVAGQVTGFAREVPRPEAVWLMTHGNGGQAADRVYALSCFAASDAVYILEYPGYGARSGSPSQAAIDAAAEAAYRELRRTYPHIPVCVVGESIGSGPASSLARMQWPPDKIVLVVPFDNLVSVAKDHFPLLPVSLLLRDRWDNAEALEGYSGKLEIYGARDDGIIPASHARRLASTLPGAVYREMPCGHNDWPASGVVKIRR